MKKDLSSRKINEKQLDKVSGGIIYRGDIKQAIARRQELKDKDKAGDVMQRSVIDEEEYGTNNIN